MRNVTLLLCLIATQIASAQPGAPQAPVEKAARADNAFGFKLMAETRKALPGSNVFQSPVGLALALVMVENGAKGETLSQMAQTLQQGGLALDQFNEANKSLMGQLLAPGQKCTLEIANGIWTLAGANIKPAFVTSAQDTYQAQAASVNFQDPAVVKNINDWVSGKTHGKIPDMVKAPLERDLRVIVMDAIYFKGAWAEPFDKKLTRDLPFTLANGTSVTHPRMSQTGKLAYFENASFQGAILPYAGRQISLVVLLPKESLDKFLQELTPENWEQWMGQFRSRQGTVELPRFKLENTYDLKDELRAMGMTRAFTTEADFSGISDERLLISWVKQKTFVEVNEEGTEAAAVSGIGISAMSVQARPEPPFRMIVDRPFYAAIRDNQTGTILFHGAIFDPR
ncbi:MAG: serpin family protein [Verrucomicrobiota bacterium]|jgi:serpin B